MITRTDDKREPTRPTVRLIGTDGNAFAVLGHVMRALREVGWSQEERDAFRAEATSGDYHHLLRVVMRHLDVE